MENLFEQYLIFIQAAKSRLTAEAYRHDLRAFVRFREDLNLSRLRKRELSPAILDQYLVWLKAQSLAPASIERRLQCLRSFFSWAAKRQFLRDNPFHWWEIPRATPRLPRALTQEEERKLFVRLHSRTRLDQIALLGFRLARFAGLRLSECNDLQWLNVDLMKGTLIVRHGKGDKDRSVPMPDAGLLQPLRLWWEKNYEPGSGLVLVGLYKQPLVKFLSTRFRHAVRAAGIVDATFHTLRSTYATRLMEAGVHPRTIQVLLGHASLETTQRYLAVADIHKRQAAQAIDEEVVWGK